MSIVTGMSTAAATNGRAWGRSQNEKRRGPTVTLGILTLIWGSRDAHVLGISRPHQTGELNLGHMEYRRGCDVTGSEHLTRKRTERTFGIGIFWPWDPDVALFTNLKKGCFFFTCQCQQCPFNWVGSTFDRGADCAPYLGIGSLRLRMLGLWR